jgi:twitching motility protein PilT
MIRENKTFQIPSLMQAGRAQGMQTMDMALERLFRGKEIAPETALEKAIDKESFAKLLKQNDLAPL